MTRQKVKRIAAFSVYFSTIIGGGYEVAKDGAREVMAEARYQQAAGMKIFQDYLPQVPAIQSDLEQRFDQSEEEGLHILQQLSIPCMNIVSGYGYSDEISVNDVLDDPSCDLDSRQIEYIKAAYDKTVSDREKLGSLIVRLIDNGTDGSNIQKLNSFATDPDSSPYRSADIVYNLNGEYTTKEVDRPGLHYSKADIYLRKWSELGMLGILLVVGLLAVRGMNTESYRQHAEERTAKKEAKRFKKEVKSAEIDTILGKILDKAENEKRGEG